METQVKHFLNIINIFILCARIIIFAYIKKPSLNFTVYGEDKARSDRNY